MKGSLRTVPDLGIVISLICATLFCSCRSTPQWYRHDSVRTELPEAVALNSGAGHGDSLFVVVSFDDGAEAVFCVDTGSPVTILDKSLEGKLGKRLATKQIASGWLGDWMVGVYPSPRIYLGKTLLKMDQNVWTTDLVRLWPNRRLMGILGMDCLHRYCIQLDFTSHHMRFIDPDSRQDWGQAFPLKVTRAGITIRTSFMNAGDVSVGIDSAEYLDGSLTSDQFQWALQANPETLVSQRTNVNGTVFREARFTSGNFGGESYSNVVVREHSGGGNTIGLHMLARHLVTLNFPKQTMYLRRRSELKVEG